VNGGCLPGLAEDDVVEVPARIDRDGARPIPQAPLSPSQAELVRRVKAFERLTVDAALSGDRAVALRALALNPLGGGPALAPELLEAILAANRQWLPRFFPDG
jgi:6-phospho-beta-glucosidase